MSKYLFLQFKRVFKILPLFLLISAVFFTSLTAVYLAFINMDNNSEKNQKFKIGIAGDPSDEYINMGVAAIQSLDSTRFALELVTVDENTAAQKLQSGEISAYAVFPKNFVEDAIHGDINPIRIVTTSSSANLVSMFKDELTVVITEIMVNSQSASYGLYDALSENEYKEIAHSALDKISIEYVGLIINRSNIYKLNVLGISDGVQLPQYLFCSLTVLYVCIMILPFAHLYIKKDNSLVTLLYSQGLSYTKQVLSEFFAFFAVLLFVFFAIIGFLSGGLYVLSLKLPDFEFAVPLVQILKYIIPVIMITASLGFLIYEFSGNLISGILTYFFTAIFLCYLSGCIYPAYMLPKSLQTVSAFLPFGAARSFLTNGTNYEFGLGSLLILFAYSISFIVLAIFIRRYKTILRSNK